MQRGRNVARRGQGRRVGAIWAREINHERYEDQVDEELAQIENERLRRLEVGNDDGAARARRFDNVGQRRWLNVAAAPIQPNGQMNEAQRVRGKSPESPALESSSSEASSDESGFDEPGRVPPVPQGVPIRQEGQNDLAQQNNGPRTPPVDVEGGNEEQQRPEVLRPFDERLRELFARCREEAFDRAFNQGEPPHVVAQRQQEEAEQEQVVPQLNAERPAAVQERPEGWNDLRNQRINRYRELQRRRQFQQHRGQMRGGFQRRDLRHQLNQQVMIRMRARDIPRRMMPPAPGLFGGVIPFNIVMAPQNRQQLELFEAIHNDRFVFIQDMGPQVIHVSGIVAISPDMDTWRCLACIRRSQEFGIWRGWWAHHLHLVGLARRIPRMQCPGCNTLAFHYLTEHRCQACVEVYSAHKNEIMMGIVFESMLGRAMNTRNQP
ncbi:hypothetical protein QAD02_013960 [Eretmocerus hayati]|uniref:Uncharacterized protein n=2 Tax=Eretmocerus hayati TaxID=131215 RepID=A0ACC2NNG6_9HYME|nr:hypothetical protein QAD02_003941 [Eretmocerus hayati]KAJ8678173.1 hypothetical protein QAD02_013960 [Eretmocerus hayati]